MHDLLHSTISKSVNNAIALTFEDFSFKNLQYQSVTLRYNYIKRNLSAAFNVSIAYIPITAFKNVLRPLNSTYGHSYLQHSSTDAFAQRDKYPVGTL